MLAQLAVAAPAVADQPAAAAFARTRTTAERALQGLLRANPGAEATWQPQLPGPALVVGLQAPVAMADPAAAVLQFARRHAALWGVRAQQLQVIGETRSRDRHTVHLGLAVTVGERTAPVLDRRLSVTVDRAKGHLLAVASDLLPVPTLRPTTVTDQAAAARGVQAMGLCEAAAKCADLGRAAPTRLAVAADLTGATPVWVVDVQAGGALKRTAVLVDAWTGAALRATPVAID